MRIFKENACQTLISENRTHLTIKFEVLTAGLEPATKKGQILNLLCLPISPSKRKKSPTLRDRRIRTPDKLHPKQPRYQTAPYPEVVYNSY